MAEELHSQANRVRDLIGDAHFLTDGHHKEYLLIDLLCRHLPAGMIAARGFVVDPWEPSVVSTEQDVLIVDTMQESPVFHQGGVVVAFPRAVRAAVSVKTRLGSESVRDSIAGLSTVRKVAASHTDPRTIWCGAYYVDLEPAVARDPTLVFGQVRRSLAAYPVTPPLSPQHHPFPLGPDLHCSARELAFRLDHGYEADRGQVVPAVLRGYRCHGLATAVFLGELLDHVAACRGSPAADFIRFADGPGTELIGEEPADGG